MNSILEKLEEIGIVPVVKIEDARNAVSLAKALCDGAQSLDLEQFHALMEDLKKRAVLEEKEK